MCVSISDPHSRSWGDSCMYRDLTGGGTVNGDLSSYESVVSNCSFDYVFKNVG